jgi:NADH-quinone oxidoreductase subunit A
MFYIFTYEYFFLFIFFLFVLFISCLLIFISYVFINFGSSYEKNSSYECGFEPFDDARILFDVKFYLVGLLFIIFDLELIFLYPWSISLSYINFYGFWSMIFFLFLLTLGFIYEWINDALVWSRE